MPIVGDWVGRWLAGRPAGWLAGWLVGIYAPAFDIFFLDLWPTLDALATSLKANGILKFGNRCRRCLRYRGYDSAGIGIQGGPLKVRKKVGKARDLSSLPGENRTSRCSAHFVLFSLHVAPFCTPLHPPCRK